MRRFSTLLVLISAAELALPAYAQPLPPLETVQHAGAQSVPTTVARLQGTRKVTSLAGLSAAELTARLGDADAVVRNEVNEQEKWSYGESSIFLSKGKVTVWIDQGELYEREQRQKLARDKPVEEQGTDPFENEWVNPWTPRTSVPKPDIVPDILEEK